MRFEVPTAVKIPVAVLCDFGLSSNTYEILTHSVCFLLYTFIFFTVYTEKSNFLHSGLAKLEGEGDKFLIRRQKWRAGRP